MNNTVVLEGEISLLNVIDGEMGEYIKIGGDIETEPLSVTENGTYTAPSGKAYTPVTVDVEGLVPTGTLQITENGTYNVTEKANAEVSVKQWDSELTEILDGTATELSGLPSSVTKIKPYAFYQKERTLPSGYTEVEYLQAVGNTYIDTQVVSSGTDTVEEKIQRTSNQDSVQSWFGSMEGTYLTRFSIGQYRQNTNRVFFVGYNYTQAIGSATTSVVTIKMGYDGSYYYSLNGDSNTYTPTSETNPTITSYIFARHGADGQSNTFDGGLTRIYYHYQWYANGTPKMMLTPCKRNSDGRLGFYDTVNRRFITYTQGSLIGGAEVPRVEIVSIEQADLSVSEIGAYAFYNNELASLTLRANQVVELGDNAIEGTPIAEGSGYIYVPQSLVSAYQANSAWSVYSSQIRAIE